MTRPMPALVWAEYATTEPTSLAADRLLADHLRSGQVAMTLGSIAPTVPEDAPEVVLIGTPEELRDLAAGIYQFVDELVEEGEH